MWSRNEIWEVEKEKEKEKTHPKKRAESCDMSSKDSALFNNLEDLKMYKDKINLALSHFCYISHSEFGQDVQTIKISSQA